MYLLSDNENKATQKFDRQNILPAKNSQSMVKANITYRLRPHQRNLLLDFLKLENGPTGENIHVTN